MGAGWGGGETTRSTDTDDYSGKHAESSTHTPHPNPPPLKGGGDHIEFNANPPSSAFLSSPAPGFLIPPPPRWGRVGVGVKLLDPDSSDPEPSNRLGWL